jgi:zinc-binding alcohol dehydrogenase/oxidoreductase
LRTFGQNLAGWSFEKAAALPSWSFNSITGHYLHGDYSKKVNTVFLSGIRRWGSNLFMLKFAIAALVLNVYVSSSSEKKIKKAIQIGAIGGINYTRDNWEQEISEMVPDGFELIVDSAAGNNFSIFPGLLKIGGRIVIFGGTAGKIPELTPAKLFWKQASILGTTMGSSEDFSNMLNFVDKMNIEPEIDKIFPFEDVEIAFKYMENQEQFGKIVIKIG